MGYSAAAAAAGVRLSLGPWLDAASLESVPAALAAASGELDAGALWLRSPHLWPVEPPA